MQHEGHLGILAARDRIHGFLLVVVKLEWGRGIVVLVQERLAVCVVCVFDLQSR